MNPPQDLTHLIHEYTTVRAWRQRDPAMMARWAAAGLWDAEIAGMAESLGLAPTDRAPVLPLGHWHDDLCPGHLSRARTEAEPNEPA